MTLSFLLLGFFHLKHIKARAEFRKHTLLLFDMLIKGIICIAAVFARFIRTCLACFLLESVGCFG